MASISYGWDVRNIAKISPKMAKKQPFFDFFRFLGVGKNFRLLMQSCCFFCFFFSRPFHENFKFLKNCHYDFHEILHSHSTPKGAPASAKASKSYGWDVRNIAKISSKMTKKQPLFDFFRFLGVGKNFRLLMQACCFFLFLGVGKNFRLLMQSCCFFSPDLFMKISNFSKTVITIFTKFCTISLHPKGPLRAQKHQNRMVGM